MSRTRNIYQIEGVYAGPAPSTGFSQLDTFGNLNNNIPSTTNFNLLQPILRVQSASYNFNIDKTEIKQLGTRGTVTRSTINPGNIDLSLEYLQYGVANEKKLGFNVNFLLEYGTNSGRAYYDDNFAVDLIGGFVSRDLIRESNELMYPFKFKDCRNIYISQETEGNDLNLQYYSNIHPRSPYLTTYGFGDCRVTNYKTLANVGDFAKCQVNFVANNMEINSSGSGISNPSVNTKTRQPIGLGTSYIPNSFQGSGYPSVLLPGDITMNFTSLPQLTGVNVFDLSGVSGSIYPNIKDIGVDFNDIKIQSYEINIPLARTNLESLGYMLPVDKQINFPVISTINISTIVGDVMTGSFIDYLNYNDDYNIGIKLIQRPNNKIAVQYDLLRCKLDSYSYQSQIGGEKTCNITFSNELASGHFLMSGLLNLDQSALTVDGFLLNEDGTYILQENGGKIIIQSASVFALI